LAGFFRRLVHYGEKREARVSLLVVLNLISPTLNVLDLVIKKTRIVVGSLNKEIAMFGTELRTDRAEKIEVCKWEEVERDFVHNMYRLRISGGWLVYINDARGRGVALTFVPDPEYKWRIE